MRSWSSINNEYSLSLESRRSNTINSNVRFILKADVQESIDTDPFDSADITFIDSKNIKDYTLKTYRKTLW